MADTYDERQELNGYRQILEDDSTVVNGMSFDSGVDPMYMAFLYLREVANNSIKEVERFLGELESEATKDWMCAVVEMDHLRNIMKTWERWMVTMNVRDEER